MPSGFESTSKLDPLKQPSFDTELNDFLNLSFTKYFTSLPEEELKSAHAGAHLPSSPPSGASVMYDMCNAIFWVYDISFQSHHFLGTIWPLSQLGTDFTTVTALPLSDQCLLLFPSYLGRSGRETGTTFPDSSPYRNQHSTMPYRATLHLPCCSLYPKYRYSIPKYQYCIPKLWGHIMFPTHTQLIMTHTCSNCITTT